MNALLRWWRFNLVGAMGMAVQLSALAMLSRLAPGHYLSASAAAVELAILHNFALHLRYTWHDRRGAFPVRTQLLRFHLSNGLVSLAGNLVLMRLLVETAHLPVLAANLTAVLCCSVVNSGRRHLGICSQGTGTAVALASLSVIPAGNLLFPRRTTACRSAWSTLRATAATT